MKNNYITFTQTAAIYLIVLACFSVNLPTAFMSVTSTLFFIFFLVNPAFIVPRHSLIDIINKKVVPFKAKQLNKRLISFFADITMQDNNNVGHSLPSQILNLAKIDRKKVISFTVVYIYLNKKCYLFQN